ncbi:helix-turn-helix transcriptional regulator [Neobacillus drentensis]|uniref:helix-turn-helix transcriptional regulator n=1 Tax=Neobacillus drentensis TaxID=220684 RepID=UPI00300199E9
MVNNLFMQYNSILYTIYAIDDFDQMKSQLLKELTSLIPCTFASVMTSVQSEKDTYLANPVCYPFEYLAVENRYLKLAESDHSQWITIEPVTTVVRITDLFSDKERENQIIYQECYVPYQLKYSVYASLAHKGMPLGLLSLYRKKEQGDFSNENLIVLKALVRHLSLRFYNEKEQCSPIKEAPKPDSGIIAYVSEYGLTRRELEVFLAITPNLTNEELAEKLHISIYTLKRHLQSLYQKTGVKKRFELLCLKSSIE